MAPTLRLSDPKTTEGESRSKGVTPGDHPRSPEVQLGRQLSCWWNHVRSSYWLCCGDMFSSQVPLCPLPLLLFQCINRLMCQSEITFPAKSLPGPVPGEGQMSIQWRSWGSDCRKVTCVTPVIWGRWGGSGHGGPDVMTPTRGWKGGPGLTHYFSLTCLVICSHLPIDHTSCAMHYCRCWDAPWGIILDKTASAWSQSVSPWDHRHRQVWELLFLDIWPLQTEAGGMPWREILQ